MNDFSDVNSESKTDKGLLLGVCGLLNLDIGAPLGTYSHISILLIFPNSLVVSLASFLPKFEAKLGLSPQQLETRCSSEHVIVCCND